MYEVGIDIGHKLPREVGARMLDQADIVVRMGVDVQISELQEVHDWAIAEPENPSFQQVRDLPVPPPTEGGRYNFSYVAQVKAF